MRRKKVEKKCQGCNETYKVQYYRRNSSKYCRMECKKKTITKTCPTCDSAFSTVPSVDQKFCKASCRRVSDETKNILRKAALNQFKNGMSDEHKKAISESQIGKPVWNQGTVIIKQCIHCGADYKALGIRKNTGLYCSMNCRSGYAYGNKDIDKRKYYLEVWKVTMRQPLQTLENFDKRGRAKKGTDNHHIDHIIPIIEGYTTGQSSEVIGDIKNLRMLHWRENIGRNTNEATKLYKSIEE